MRTIEKLFGKSPFGPLVEHTRMVHDTVKLTRPLLEAFMAEEWERVEELHGEISSLEHDADVQKSEIRDHLPKSMFLPIDRGDVLHYLKEQDAIADATEDLSVILTLRDMPTPAELEPVILDFADQVIGTSERLLETGLELSDLVEASFAGPEADRVLEMAAQVNDQEWEADKRERKLTRALLAQEDGLDPVSIILWMKAIDVLGRVANHAENCADLLRMMLARQ